MWFKDIFGEEKMLKQGLNMHYRFFMVGLLITALLILAFATAADARRARRAVQGAVIGAGVGAIVNGGRGARRGAAAGAIIGAVR